MGNCTSVDHANYPTPAEKYIDNMNIHQFNPALKIHAVVSPDLDIGIHLPLPFPS